MRRYIAYLTLSAAMLIASGAALAPTVMNMDADLAYAEGQTFYFKASEYLDESQNGNYGVADQYGALEFLTEDDIDKNGEYIVEDIAATMRTRLDTWGISEYEVKTQGYDTIAVSLRTPKDSSIQYNYLKDYLSFSGQDYEIDASNTTADSSDEDGAYNHNSKWETLLDGQTARIEEIDMNSYSVPVVVMPIANDEESKDAFLKLLEYCAKNTQEEEKDDDGNVTQEAKACSLVLWSNRLESDKYEDKSNPNIGAKIIGEWNASHDQCVWYASDDDKENKTNPHLQLIPKSDATSGESYDPNHTKEAYEAAVYLCNKLNASNYSYTNSSNVETKYAVSFTYSETAKASVENFVELGAWTMALSSTRTLWASIGIIVALAIVLAFYERIFAIHHVANVMAVGVSSLLLFSAFGSQFNIAALIGLGVTAAITLFGSLYYSRKLKDELYKGRTLKKANQEASKKSTLPIIDFGVIAIIVGIFVYIFGGDIASKAGVMLVSGGVLSIAANLILTRLQFWLLANDSTFPSHIQKQLGIQTDRIPNLAEEEKQTYFGAYAEKDFTKGKKISLVALCLLLLGGIGTMIGFGIANNGDVYNDASYRGGGTVLRIDLRADKENQVYALQYSEEGKIFNEDAAKDSHDDIFHQYRINGKTLAELTSNFSVSESPKVVYSVEAGAETPTEYHWYYYQAELANKLIDDNNLLIENWNGNAWANTGYTSLEDLSTALIMGDDANIIVSFKQIDAATLTPYLGQIALGVGIGLACVLLYMVIRYRPSRGIAATLLVTSTSYLSVAFFTITRIATAPVAGLAAIPVAVIGMGLTIFILASEKNIYRESREKDKTTLEFHNQCLDLALRRESGTTIIAFLLAWAIAIIALLGPYAYFMPHLGWVIGLAFTLMAILTLMVPFALVLAKAFSKIKFKPIKKKKKKGGQLMKKRNSAEPEEAIFIGIND